VPKRKKKIIEVFQVFRASCSDTTLGFSEIRSKPRVVAIQPCSRHCKCVYLTLSLTLFLLLLDCHSPLGLHELLRLLLRVVLLRLWVVLLRMWVVLLRHL
jgi:hypothetical protein